MAKNYRDSRKRIYVGSMAEDTSCLVYGGTFSDTILTESDPINYQDFVISKLLEKNKDLEKKTENRGNKDSKILNMMENAEALEKETGKYPWYTLRGIKSRFAATMAFFDMIDNVNRVYRE